jgi:hypothetical protein
MSGGASAATASGLASSSITATTTIKDDDEVPRDDAETAARMIRSALDNSPPSWFDMKTFAVKEGLVIDLNDLVIDFDDPNPSVIKIIGRRPDRVHIDLADHSNHLTIWFNAQESMGGRTVENGHGPQYYRTFGELKRGIRNAVLELGLQYYRTFREMKRGISNAVLGPRNPLARTKIDSQHDDADNDDNDKWDDDENKLCDKKEKKQDKGEETIKSSTAAATTHPPNGSAAAAPTAISSVTTQRLKGSTGTGANKRRRRRGWTAEQLQRWRRRKHAAARANAKRLHGGAAQPTPT